MSVILQLLFNGLIAGAIYALVASGFSLIYSTGKFFHFAHGGIIAFSAYLLYLLFSVLGLNFALSVILAVLLSSFLGWLVNVLVYKQLRKRKVSNITILISGFSLLVIFESLILMFFGADVKVIGDFEIQRGIDIFGAVVSPLQIYMIITSFVLLILLFWFMKNTKIGKAMRAVSDNKDIAEVMGISSEKIYSWSMIIGSIIGAIAGILISLEQNLEPVVGTNLMIKGFTGVIIGGMGSVPGAILGSFLLGFTENFGIWFLSPNYKDVITFTLLFVFLLFKPKGIFGIQKR